MLRFELSRSEAECLIDAVMALPEDEVSDMCYDALETIVVGCGICQQGENFDEWYRTVRSEKMVRKSDG